VHTRHHDEVPWVLVAEEAILPMAAELLFFIKLRQDVVEGL